MWKFSFLAAIWTIWKQRNRRFFEGLSPNESQMGEKIKHLVATWALCSAYPSSKEYQELQFYTIGRQWPFSYPHRPRISKRWIPPPSSVLKLNFDGCALGHPRLAGVRGIIHTEVGTFYYITWVQLEFALSTKQSYYPLTQVFRKHLIMAISRYSLRGTPNV